MQVIAGIAIRSTAPADGKGSIIISSTGIGVPPLDMRIKGIIAKITELRSDLTIISPVSTAGVGKSSPEILAARGHFGPAQSL